jgi:hypothetical protein
VAPTFKALRRVIRMSLFIASSHVCSHPAVSLAGFRRISKGMRRVLYARCRRSPLANTFNLKRIPVKVVHNLNAESTFHIGLHRGS